jgi:hypothetical protein
LHGYGGGDDLQARRARLRIRTRGVVRDNEGERDMNDVADDRQTGPVLTVGDIGLERLQSLLACYGMICEQLAEGCEITGSFWGDSEAGLVGNRLLVRADTPVHSALHEACHYVCMTPDRRAGLHTDAGGDYDEENAVCYLQILLADLLEGAGRERLMADMDAWGYSFRLGSAKAWFEQDADDVSQRLLGWGLIEDSRAPVFRLRGA